MPATTTRLLSIAAAAEQLSCSRGHVYNLIALGHFKAVDIRATGKRPKTRVLASEVEAYIARQTRSTA